MQKVLHETCQQYVARRLSEGWKIIYQKGYRLVLSSPDGNILRPVDLRNDTLTLSPNAAGDETSITNQYPSSTYHWDKVDDPPATPDDGATYVFDYSGTYRRDLYRQPGHTTEQGTINFIKIYFRVWSSGGLGFAKPSLKSDSTVIDGTEITGAAWATFSQQWNTNPADSQAWDWADIDALQIGVSLNGTSGQSIYCTQVYVEVDYTLPFTVTTQDAGTIGSTAATGYGTIVSTGGQNCTVRGVKYGLTQTDTWDVHETGSFGVGIFTEGMTGLSASTIYWYRGYATNPTGTQYGSYVSFATKAATTVNIWRRQPTQRLSSYYLTNKAIGQSGAAIANEFFEILPFIDETGKVQIVLAAQAESDFSIRADTARLQVVLAIQGETDTYIPASVTYDETGRIQIVLAVQGEGDSIIRSDTVIQIVLAAQGLSDFRILPELANLQTVLGLHAESDFLILPELSREQVIFSVLGHQDNAILSETDKLQVLLALQGLSDFRILSELSTLQIVLGLHNESDFLILPELSREQVILGLQDISDNRILGELANLQTILGLQGITEQTILGELLLQVILAAQGETDVHTGAFITYYETGLTQTILAPQEILCFVVFYEFAKLTTIMGIHDGPTLQFVFQ